MLNNRNHKAIMNIETKCTYIAPLAELLYINGMNLLQSPSVDHEIYGDIEETDHYEPEMP